jgi:hypothetical protein
VQFVEEDAQAVDVASSVGIQLTRRRGVGRWWGVGNRSGDMVDDMLALPMLVCAVPGAAVDRVGSTLAFKTVLPFLG